MNPQGKKAQVFTAGTNTHFFVTEFEKSESFIRAWSSLLSWDNKTFSTYLLLDYFFSFGQVQIFSFVSITRLGSAEDSDEEYPNIGKKATLLAVFNQLFESSCYDNCGK